MENKNYDRTNKEMRKKLEARIRFNGICMHLQNGDSGIFFVVCDTDIRALLNAMPLL